MMKIFLSLLMVFLYFFMKDYFFWLISGVLIFFLIFFMKWGMVWFNEYYLSMGVYLDLFSLMMLILSFWVVVVMFLASYNVYSTWSYNYFFIFVIFLLFALVFTFSVNNLLGFYFFFEFSLIPTLLIIMGWGYQPERLQAGIYFVFYTLFASLPLLFSLIFFFWKMGTLDISLYLYFSLLEGYIFFLVLFMILAFLVKMPMFTVHLWLPKAHLEAPVAGSMILAGVLLKLGGYGLYRVFDLVSLGLIDISSYFMGLSIAGMVVVGFLCLRLNDLKALVAYSSVAHMGLVICGIFSFYLWGWMGGLIMMISHGICSSGLFMMVNYYYERSGSRMFFLNRGMLSLYSVYTLMFFLLCVANMAAPPSINLFSEISLMGSIVKFNKIMILLFPLGSFLGAVFSLYLFSYSQHGKNFISVLGGGLGNFREYLVAMVHIIPLNFLLLKIDYFLLFW